MKREPLITVAGLTTLVTALLGLLVAFGVDLTDKQTGAILALAAAVGPWVVALVGRGRVTPVE